MAMVMIRDSSSDSTNIKIIAAAAGGGGGLVVLCCLMLVMAALSWGWKRGRSPYRKLKQPDYAQIAYGDVKNDVVIPKRQADVRARSSSHFLLHFQTDAFVAPTWHHQHYLTLERLIIAPDLRLAHAILQSARHGDLDVVRSSFPVGDLICTHLPIALSVARHTRRLDPCCAC